MFGKINTFHPHKEIYDSIINSKVLFDDYSDPRRHSKQYTLNQLSTNHPTLSSSEVVVKSCGPEHLLGITRRVLKVGGGRTITVMQITFKSHIPTIT